MSEILTTSPLRANIIAWLPIEQHDRVLYLGEEQIILDKLLEMTADVQRVKIPEEIAPEENYDYILTMGDASLETLRMLGKHLTKGGKLVLAAENAYGLKYLAGVKEIGSKEYFGGVEGAKQAIGYTRQELVDNLNAAGFAEQKYYYPFPDYRFAMSIYSDAYLPKQGELIDQIGNFDEERLVLFDESKAADLLLTRGKFQEFSNSYLIVAGKEPGASLVNHRGEDIAYVKFSNDRGRIHNIRTYITCSADGRRHLLKQADSGESIPQIVNLAKTAQVLEQLYADSGLQVNACTLQEDTAELEFLQGHTMEEELDGLLEQGDYAKAEEALFSALKRITDCKHKQTFQMTGEFQKVFGKLDMPDNLQAVPVGDIDMIMPNILIGDNGTWTVIDYEWSFHFPIPENFIKYRAIRYYADTTAVRRRLNPESLYEKAGITRWELEIYESMEESFQMYVLDGHIPMRQHYKEIGKPAYHISSLLHVADELQRKRALQIYFDRGAGFGENDMVWYHSKALDGTYHLEVSVGEDIKQLRIDPGSQACTVDIERLSWKNHKESVAEFISNGHKMDGNMYLFDTEDPNILLTQIPAKDRILQLDIRIEAMSLAAAEWIAPKIDKKYKLKKMLKK